MDDVLERVSPTLICGNLYEAQCDVTSLYEGATLYVENNQFVRGNHKFVRGMH